MSLYAESWGALVFGSVGAFLRAITYGEGFQEWDYESDLRSAEAQAQAAPW